MRELLFTAAVVALIVVLVVLNWRARHIAGQAGRYGSFICASCGSRSEGISRTRGSFWIELVLWLCFILPGLIYSIWRLTTKERVCPQCGAPGLVPTNTPRGRDLVARYNTQQ